jgi:hypothetical protein
MMPTQPDHPSSPAESWIPEEEIAALLNVPREKIRAERPYLGAGEVVRKGNVISWQRVAAARVAAKLGLQLTLADASAEDTQKNAPPPEADFEELTVCSQPMRSNGPHFGNQFLIKATRANKEIVIVRVLNSSKFLPKLHDGKPMVIKAKKSPAGNWWALVGREPRFPGRW